MKLHLAIQIYKRTTKPTETSPIKQAIDNKVQLNEFKYAITDYNERLKQNSDLKFIHSVGVDSLSEDEIRKFNLDKSCSELIRVSRTVADTEINKKLLYYHQGLLLSRIKDEWKSSDIGRIIAGVSYNNFVRFCEDNPDIRMSAITVLNRIKFSKICIEKPYIVYLRNISYTELIKMSDNKELSAICKEAMKTI